MSDSIAFPNLGIYLPHVIKSFSVFGYEIAVYGITMALGILAGMYMAVYVAKNNGYKPTNDNSCSTGDTGRREEY